jgi:hypothetical protein
VNLANSLMEMETLDRTEFEKLMNDPSFNGQLPSEIPLSEEETSLNESLVEKPALGKAT